MKFITFFKFSGSWFKIGALQNRLNQVSNCVQLNLNSSQFAKTGLVQMISSGVNQALKY